MVQRKQIYNIKQKTTIPTTTFTTTYHGALASQSVKVETTQSQTLLMKCNYKGTHTYIHTHKHIHMQMLACHIT